MTNAYSVWEREWAGANCANMDTDIFFMPDDDKLNRKERSERILRAKRICNGCPVMKRCQNYAINHNEVGVWGGMTEKERNELQRTARMFLSSKNRSKLFL